MWARIDDGRVAEIITADPVGRHHPDLEFVPCGPQVEIGDIFDGETYQSGTSVVDAATARIATLSADCEAAITGGFVSSALGTPHTYQSDRDDQTNLLGSHATALATGQSVPHKCRDENSVWAYRLHTPAQMTQVLADGAATKLGHLQRFGLLRDQVQAIVAATSLLPDDPDYLTDDAARAAIAAVVWA